MKVAAIYARVSSERQKEEQTIASQTAALIRFAQDEGYTVPQEWVFEDEGYSGSRLGRPGLERGYAIWLQRLRSRPCWFIRRIV